LQEQEHIKKESLEKEVIIQELITISKLLDVRRLPYATIYQIGIQETELGEFFCFPQNNRFIRHLEPRQFLFGQNTRINKHLELFGHHFEL
jgi:hypothetical protein